jgi:hypothetical protein
MQRALARAPLMSCAGNDDSQYDFGAYRNRFSCATAPTPSVLCAAAAVCMPPWRVRQPCFAGRDQRRVP